MSVMIYNMAFQGDGPILSGAVNGKAAFAVLIGFIKDGPIAPSPLLLDFADVDVATASYLRESVFSFKTYLRASSSKVYPVVANANANVIDELQLLANAKNDAIISCRFESNNITEIELIGSLDPKQQMTFDLVHELKVTDANQLMEQWGTEENTKSTTAWNNRLASLASRGLIREFNKGRSKFYKPVLEVKE